MGIEDSGFSVIHERWKLREKQAKPKAVGWISFWLWVLPMTFPGPPEIYTRSCASTGWSCLALAGEVLVPWPSLATCWRSVFALRMLLHALRIRVKHLAPFRKSGVRAVWHLSPWILWRQVANRASGRLDLFLVEACAKRSMLKTITTENSSWLAWQPCTHHWLQVSPPHTLNYRLFQPCRKQKQRANGGREVAKRILNECSSRDAL